MADRPHALVLEDDADLNNLFAEALRMAGYQVTGFLDSKQALAWLSGVTPALIVLDLNLPVLSGEDFLAQISKDPRNAGTRIIIASADEQTVKELADSVDLALVKPISFTQLRDLAARLHPDFKAA